MFEYITRLSTTTYLNFKVLNSKQNDNTTDYARIS